VTFSTISDLKTAFYRFDYDERNAKNLIIVTLAAAEKTANLYFTKMVDAPG
jgi:hypothetical protein